MLVRCCRYRAARLNAGCVRPKQGYELRWWKARHNIHHVVANEVGADPDIQTKPVLYFVQQYPMLRMQLRHVQRLQHLYYLPLLCLLDAYWRAESAIFIARRLRTMLPHAALLGLHYVLLAVVARGSGWFPILVMSLLRGFGTATVVFASHYSEERLTHRAHGLSLLEQTVRTSRNIAGGPVLHFLTGYISLQIEHHLFPTMPRVHLARAKPRVMDLCRKHGLPYAESSLLESLRRNLASLVP